jgi:hypothetical protein
MKRCAFNGSRIVRLALFAGALGACSNDRPVAGTGTGGAGSGGGGAAGLSGTGGAGASGGGGAAGSGAGSDECRTDADCPQPVCGTPPCSELLCSLGGDGLHHCVDRTLPDVPACLAGFGGPCCASDAECTAKPNGHCFADSFISCGPPPPLPTNECRYDACRSDADCVTSPNGFCTAGYPRQCLYGPCRTNADCTAHPGGRCVLDDVTTFCFPFPVVFCRYPSDPCASTSDCRADGGGLVCLPNLDLQGESCQALGPAPP